MRTRWVSLALLVAVGVAGCGSRAEQAVFSTERFQTATPSPTPEFSATPPPAPGPDTFIADARMLDLGDKDMIAATDEQILSLGRAVCGLFDTQDAPTSTMRRAGYEIIVQYVRTLAGGATEADARAFTTSAIINLCPVNADVLQPGAIG